MLTLKNAVVLDLPRKSRNGTRFTFKREGNYAVGYATVLKTTKDGLVTASVDGLMEQIQFHTSDKAVWPNAKAKS